MAHQIVDSQIAYQNQVPWHGLGTKMDPNQSTEEWLKAAKLDWEVKTIPLIGRDEETGEEIKAQNRAMFVRSSDKKILTYASESWTPLQNRDAVDFMQRYVSAGDAQIETVGALRDGQIIWCLANLNHQFEVRPGDLTNGYLLITSPHVAGQAIRVQTTTVRVVCANTMAAANRSAELHYRQSHRAEFNVDLAAAAVASAHDELSKMEKRCKILDKLKINAQDAIEKVILPIFDEGVQEVEGIDVMSPDSLPKADLCDP